MTLYNKSVPTVAGGTGPTWNVAASGDQINGAKGAVLIIRTVGTATVCTIDTPGTLPNGDAYPNKEISLGTNAEKWIVLGAEYCDASGIASLSWSATTAVTWAVVALP